MNGSCTMLISRKFDGGFVEKGYNKKTGTCHGTSPSFYDE